MRSRSFLPAVGFVLAATIACSEGVSSDGASVQVRAPVSTQVLVPGAADILRKTRPNTLVLDVRTRKEFEEGHLPGAVRIHVDELDDVVDSGRFPASTSQPVLVYCTTGKRSSRAAEILSDRGYTEVFDLVGGIEAWEREGLPIER